MQKKRNFTMPRKIHTSTSTNFYLQSIPKANYFQKFRQTIQNQKTVSIKSEMKKVFDHKFKTHIIDDSSENRQKINNSNTKLGKISRYQQLQKINSQAQSKDQFYEQRLNLEQNARKKYSQHTNTFYRTLNVKINKKTTIIDTKLHNHKNKQQEMINYKSYHRFGQSSIRDDSYRHAWGLMVFQNVLGTGAYATVKLARSKDNSYAVKIYEKYKLLDVMKKKRVHSEIAILKQLPRHPNIIYLHDSLQDKRQVHLIFQYLPDSQTLLEYFKKSYLRLDIQVIKFIYHFIVQGIAHLHQNGVGHRDIKPQNILISENKDQQFQIKMIDFGFSSKKKKTDLQCGTPNFMAPQIFNKYTKYDCMKADIWALGITLFYLCEGRYPFKGFNEKQLIKLIRLGKYETTKIVDCNILQMIENTLKVEPSQRWTIQQLITSTRQWINYS